MPVSDKVFRRIILPVALIVVVLVVIFFVSPSTSTSTSAVLQESVSDTETVVTLDYTPVPALSEYYNERYSMRLVDLYFYKESTGGALLIQSVERPVFYLSNMEVASMDALFSGLTEQEVLGNNLFTMIPPTTSLDVSVGYPTLTVDVQFAETPSEELLPYILYQIVATGLQFDYITGVHVVINGRPVSFSYGSERYKAPFSSMILPVLEGIIF